MSDNRNFLLAIVLSMGVLLLWQTFIGGPAMEEERARLEAEQRAAEDAAVLGQGENAPSVVGDVTAADTGVPRPDATAQEVPTPATGTARPAAAGALLERTEAMARTERIAIDTPALQGSIALTGALVDDLSLKRYRVETDPESPIITLLSPRGTAKSYYGRFGWTTPPGSDVAVPDATTPWTAVAPGPLTPERPVTLFWENGQGLRFTLTFSIDENYLITVDQGVANESGAPVTLYPFGLVAKRGRPESQGFWILHEGFLGVFDDALTTFGWDGLDGDSFTTQTDTGWLGLTSKYWMTVLAPAGEERFTARFNTRPGRGATVYQTDYLGEGRTIDAGQSAEAKMYFFAGAKKVSLINQYEEANGIQRFDLAIDWGWFFFLTKPFFTALNFLFTLTGNFGVAILVFTVLVKLLFFPLANKSYEAITKMKKIQPELMKLRDRFKDDKMRQQQEMMELYKREKVNPLAGCVPVLLQIPVFFALYKVLFVTIEMRHAPFFGWIQDLSAPDPTTIFNLFGLIPWDPSTVPMVGPFLMLGVWPIFMGITMWLQMQMNPQPTDEIQQKVFAYMPFIFTIMLASFAAGLVIYWAWNNLLSILQQYVIMRRMGVDPEWKNNIKVPSWLSERLSGSAKEEGLGAGPREGQSTVAASEDPNKPGS